MISTLDIINSIIQSIIISYFPYYCLKRESSGNREYNLSKVIYTSIIIFINVCVITGLIGGTSLSIIIINIFNMIIIVCSYFNNYNKSLTAYFIVYFIFQISSIIIGNIHWSYLESLINNIEVSTVLTVYIPVLIVELCIFIFRDKLYSAYRMLRRYKYCLEVGLFSVIAFDYILSLSLIIHGKDEVVFKNLIITSSIILVVGACAYMISINKKMNEIERLNNALSSKNNELKKIKHDYGSQISYINGLYIMEQYGRLGELLRHIIDGNNKVSGSIKVISDESSIIACVVNSLDIENINMIVEEETDITDLNISEYELQKILSNIISNSITALGGTGLIIVKTYKIFNNMYISIKNDGPKIDENIIKKIFDEGFTTKKDLGKKENGYGLHIVKELVKKNNGNIYVESTDDYTEFKIIFSMQNN